MICPRCKRDTKDEHATYIIKYGKCQVCKLMDDWDKEECHVGFDDVVRAMHRTSRVSLTVKDRDLCLDRRGDDDEMP